MSKKKEKEKRRHLSVIVEATEVPPHARTPFKARAASPMPPRSLLSTQSSLSSLQPPRRKTVPAVDATHFEYVRTLSSEGGAEAILARKLDDGRVYTVRLVRKSARGAEHDAAARMRRAQAALRTLTAQGAPFVQRLWWSFDDDRAMYLVVVSGLQVTGFSRCIDPGAGSI